MLIDWKQSLEVFYKRQSHGDYSELLPLKKREDYRQAGYPGQGKVNVSRRMLMSSIRGLFTLSKRCGEAGEREREGGG